MMSTQQDMEFQRRQDTILEEEEEKQSVDGNMKDISLMSFYENVKIKTTKDGMISSGEGDDDVNVEMVFEEEKRKTLGKSIFHNIMKDKAPDNDGFMSPDRSVEQSPSLPVGQKTPERKASKDWLKTTEAEGLPPLFQDSREQFLLGNSSESQPKSLVD